LEFTEAEINSIRQAIGRSGQYRLQCPACSGDRKKHRDRSLSVNLALDGFLKIQCWHCERSVGIPDKKHRKPSKSIVMVEKKVKKMPLSNQSIQFLKSRCIGKAASEYLNLSSSPTYFPQIQSTLDSILFPYHNKKDKIYGHKIRSSTDKYHICDSKLNTFFNIGNVDLEDCNQIIITEGELDVLSLVEAKIPNPISVPNGAAFSDRDDGSVFEYLWNAKELIDKVKRVIIFSDTDEKGSSLAEELARRIGRFKCWRTLLPDDCKDANDVLMKYGKEKLKEIVDTAAPWPVSGLYEASDFIDKMMELYDNDTIQRVSTGFDKIDHLYSVSPGVLTVVTGIPGSGKSTMIDQIMMNLAMREDWKFAVCSFENNPEIHIGKLLEMKLQKDFFEREGIPRMSKDEINTDWPWVNEHFKFICQLDGNPLPIETIIENIKAAVFRWGIKGCVIDPYNYITRPKSSESETQWISDMLTAVRMVAAAYGLHIWFVAHPTKIHPNEAGNYSPPTGYSISGSAAWYSKADFGLTIHRNNGATQCQFIIWKCRFSWLGEEGKETLVYNKSTHVYSESVLDSVIGCNEKTYSAFQNEGADYPWNAGVPNKVHYSS